MLKVKAVITKTLGWRHLGIAFAVVGAMAVGGAAKALVVANDPPAATAVKESPVEKPDYALLLRAIKGLKESTTFGYTAVSNIQGNADGLNVLINQKLEAVLLRDGKLHTDISVWLGSDAEKAKKFTVVSDGAKLFTHQPGMNRYSTKPLSDTKLSDETSRIGLLGGLYYNNDLINMVNQVTPENVEQVFEQLQGIGLKFSGSKIGETPIFTLTIKTPKAPAAAEKTDTADAKKPVETPAIVMRFYVDPETAQFRQLEIRGQEGGTRFTLTEKIVRQSNQPVYEVPAFRFVPSAKDTKVADVPVDLFNK